MSEPSSGGPEKTVPAKKPVSPARNIIGLIVLVGVLAYGAYEYSFKNAFNAAVAKLEARTLDEDKGLMTVQEAEGLMGKEPDGPAVDFKENDWTFAKKTYTWRGLLKQYTLTAYYTTEKNEPHLHHYETEGTKVELPKAKTVTAPAGPSKGGGGGATKGSTGKQAAERVPLPRRRPRPIPRVNPLRRATRLPRRQTRRRATRLLLPNRSRQAAQRPRSDPAPPSGKSGEPKQ